MTRRPWDETVDPERHFVAAVLDTARALVLALDREGRIVRFNRACERATGYAAGEVTGRLFVDLLIPPEDRACAGEAFQGILAGQGPSEGTAHLLTGSGERRLIAWSAATVDEDGGVTFVVATGIDITERQRAQEKLRLYRQIFDRCNDGIVIFDREGRLIERNPADRLSSGYADAEVLGRTAAELFGEEVTEPIMKVLREEGAFRGEILARHKEGRVIPVDVSAFSLQDPKGEVGHFVGIGRDVTERKQAEEELRRAHDELERRVRERTTELARVNQKLSAEIAEREQAELALRESQTRLSRQNAILAELAKRLSPERSPLDTSLRELTEAAARTLEVSRASVWMYDAQRSAIECLDVYDERAGRHESGLRLSAAQYPAYFRALGDERTLSAGDAHRDPRTCEFSESYLTPLQIGAMLDAPIWLAGKMVGVVCHEHVGEPRRWTPEEERFAASIADFTSLTLEAHALIKSEEALRRAHDELEQRVEERTKQLARMNVAYRDEIRERQEAQEALSTRLRYEEGLAACSQALLAAEAEDALGRALGHLLRASGASGVYVFENFEDPQEGLSMRETHIVSADAGISDSNENPALSALAFGNLPYGRGFDRWRHELAAGRPVGGFVATLPLSERQYFLERGILSILALPIFLEGQWHGFLGFLDRRSERNWSREDVRSLKTASDMIGVFIQRRSVAEALRVSEERFRTLVENANDIIYSLTPDGVLTYISPKFTEATGYPVQEYLGQPLFSLLHPDDQAAARGWLESGFATQERVSGFEHRFRHRDGEWRWFVAAASVMRDEEGQPREIIAISHDITRVKLAAYELARANRELREAQTQLVQSEKMASLGMLVAGIAHEINTPVGAIASMHDTLVRGVAKLERSLEAGPGSDVDAEEWKEPIAIVREANRVIRSAVDRVTTIVRRLRSFARLDEAELKRVDIHEGIEDTLTLLHHELKRNITVIRDYADVPPIACYPGRLNQVFLNLLNNARQAISGCGEIEIRTFVHDDRVHIAFRDTGSGIAPEHLRKIFDPGFTTKGVGVGTGLGLSICYQIVRDHQGEIRVDSEPGLGSTFTVILPMQLDEQAPRGAPGRP